MTGDPEGLPTVTGTWIADYLGGMLFAQGIMAALAAREHTGRGQIVDSCLLNSVVASHLQESTGVLNTGQKYPRPPAGGGHAWSGPLYAVYECKDGKFWALMGGFVPDPLESISTALEIRPPLGKDPRFNDIDMTSDEAWVLRPLLEEAFMKFTRDEVEERFDEQNLPPGAVYEPDEVFDDPQVIHNDLVVETEHPSYGRVKMTGFPVKLSNTPATLRRAPPTVGEHNEDVMREFGYSDEEIRGFQEVGAVGSENLKRAHATAAG
jgi:formyl-CoA transferase